MSPQSMIQISGPGFGRRVRINLKALITRRGRVRIGRNDLAHRSVGIVNLRTADDDDIRHVGHVINPVLDELDPAKRRLDESVEGCLSVPGAYCDLARPDYAVVRGCDVTGQQIAVAGTGYFARCLQHETDHLNGYLYIDRLSKRDRKDALRQMSEKTPEYQVVAND